MKFPQNALSHYRIYRVQKYAPQNTTVLIEDIPARSESEAVQSWRGCDVKGCLGEQVDGAASCVAHLDDEAFAEWAKHSGGIMARGVEFNRKFLARLADTDHAGHEAVRSYAMLVGSQFSAPTRFDWVSVSEPVNLLAAHLKADVEVRDTDFSGFVHFQGTTLDSSLIFRGCIFRERVGIAWVRGQGKLRFIDCKFMKGITVHSARIAIDLSGSKVDSPLAFTSEVRSLNFSGSTIEAAIDLEDLYLDEFIANGTRFGQRASEMRIRSTRVDLAGAVFQARVNAEIVGEYVDASNTTFEAGGLVRFQGRSINLSRVRTSDPLRLVGEGSELPLVEDLSNADAGRLSLAHVDLSQCSFVGTHRLADLYLDSTVKFDRKAGRGARRRIWDEVRLEKESKSTTQEPRLVLPEGSKSILHPPSERRFQGAGYVLSGSMLTAHDVSSIYRELRRGFEARSDMSGAADFYVGEMEMRRRDTLASSTEHFLIAAYSVVSRYGTDPKRAALWYLSAVIVGTLLLWVTECGTIVEPSGGVLLVALKASLPVLALQNDLTDQGRWVQLFLRVTCTLMLAMMVLAVKSTIMRKPSE